MQKTLKLILETADKGYHRDGQIMAYANGGKDLGDGLAQFIATEIVETFDRFSHCSTGGQIFGAIHYLENAETELSRVIAQLRVLAVRADGARKKRLRIDD